VYGFLILECAILPYVSISEIADTADVSLFYTTNIKLLAVLSKAMHLCTFSSSWKW